jgi:hypothetical protein
MATARNHHRARAINFVTCIFVVAILLASCGTPGKSGLDAAHRSPPNVVAVEFAKELFHGRFRIAENFVNPSDRQNFLLLTIGLKPSSVETYELRIGHVVSTGSHAVVTLTGTICSSGNFRSIRSLPKRKYCDSNSDPVTSNPIFRFELSRFPGGRWFVDVRL